MVTNKKSTVYPTATQILERVHDFQRQATANFWTANAGDNRPMDGERRPMPLLGRPVAALGRPGAVWDGVDRQVKIYFSP